MTPEELIRINDNYIRAYDKWFRMYAGLSTRLNDYHNRCIYLEIRHSDRWRKPPLVTVRQMVEYWYHYLHKSLELERFIVRLVRIRYSEGIVLNDSQLQHADAVEQAVAQLKAAVQEPVANEQEVSYFQGRFSSQWMGKGAKPATQTTG